MNKQKNERGQVSTTLRYELVKFDGEVPAPGELKEPAEILRGDSESTMETVYRAGKGSVLKLFTGDPATGYAVLAKERSR